MPRTKGILGFAQHMPSDQRLHTTDQLLDKISMILGGRASESMIFRKITTGAQDDLKRVTDMAYKQACNHGYYNSYILILQVLELGMSPVIGHVSLPVASVTEPGKVFYSQKLSKMADEVRKYTNYSLSVSYNNRRCAT